MRSSGAHQGARCRSAAPAPAPTLLLPWRRAAREQRTAAYRAFAEQPRRTGPSRSSHTAEGSRKGRWRGLTGLRVLQASCCPSQSSPCGKRWATTPCPPGIRRHPPRCAAAPGLQRAHAVAIISQQLCLCPRHAQLQASSGLGARAVGCEGQFYSAQGLPRFALCQAAADAAAVECRW